MPLVGWATGQRRVDGGRWPVGRRPRAVAGAGDVALKASVCGMGDDTGVNDEVGVSRSWSSNFRDRDFTGLMP